jgi:DNA-binding beta-propeller fold protein YncE
VLVRWRGDIPTPQIAAFLHRSALLTTMHSRVPFAALALAFAAACGPSQPGGAPSPRDPRDPRTAAQLDSMRRNTVIENARPDAPARAGVLVVANQQGANATILDAGTLRTIATVPVGIGPHETAVSPDGRWAVVTNYGTSDAQGNTLSVIDLAAPTPVVTRTIDLGEYHRPHGAAFFGRSGKLVVTSETAQRLVIVDFPSGRVDTALATNARGSHMVTVRRDGRRAWTANIQDGNVTEFDLDARRTLRTFPAAPMDEGIAVTPNGSDLWVGSNEGKTVTVIDAGRGQVVQTLEGFGFPYRIGISRNGRIAVVNDPVTNRVWLFDAPSRRRIAELDLKGAPGVAPSAGGTPGGAGAGPEGVAFDPIADFAYVTLHGTNQVAAVDLTQRRIVAAGNVGAGPDGIAYSPIVRRP